MGLILWMILGLIAGYLASLIMKTNASQGPVMDIILGVVGAVVGGFLMNFFGADGVNGLNVYSLVVATMGAVVTIWIGRVLTARTV